MNEKRRSCDPRVRDLRNLLNLHRFNPLRILERCEATALGSQSSSSEIWWEAANRRWSWTHKITDPQSMGRWELRTMKAIDPENTLYSCFLGAYRRSGNSNARRLAPPAPENTSSLMSPDFEEKIPYVPRVARPPPHPRGPL